MSSNEFGSNAQKSQLECYLEEPKMPRNVKLDILAFWKSNQFRYPDLASMARDILSIPVSTVASEACFSIGGRVLDQYRSSLKPDIAEAIICLRDWIAKGRKGYIFNLFFCFFYIYHVELNINALFWCRSHWRYRFRGDYG